MSVKIAGCHCQKMCYILVAVKFVAEFSSFTAKELPPSLHLRKSVRTCLFSHRADGHSLLRILLADSRVRVSRAHTTGILHFLLSQPSHKGIVSSQF